MSNPDASSASAPQGMPVPPNASATVERFADCFEKSARRWERIVYPSLFAFIVLAIYGFYLVFNLTRDMHQVAKDMSSLARSFDPKMSQHMASIAHSVEGMYGSVDAMAHNINAMDVNLQTLTVSFDQLNNKMTVVSDEMRNLETIQARMGNIDHSARNMAVQAAHMGNTMGSMNRSFTPVGMMSRFMPW